MEEEIRIEVPDLEGRAFSHEGLFETTLSKINDITQHLDHQSNILIGLGSGVFVFAAAGYEKDSANIALLVMAIFSALSALVGLIAIHPLKSMRKRGQEESMLYNKKIAGYSSAAAYEKDLAKITADPKKIQSEYSKEIYNLCKYYYRPKRKLFHVSRNLFFTGIILSLGVFLSTLF
jgi:Family of unknown function (DUF5706)